MKQPRYSNFTVNVSLLVGIEKFIWEKQCAKGRKSKPVDIEGNQTAFAKEEGFDENGCLGDLEVKLFINHFFASVKWHQKLE